jgi:hypothetical protein
MTGTVRILAAFDLLILRTSPLCTDNFERQKRRLPSENFTHLYQGGCDTQYAILQVPLD